jgi:translocation and assembly module TamB
MKKILAARIFFILLILSFLFCGFLLGTGIGLQLVQKNLGLLSGGRISIGQVEGQLLGQVTLEEIGVNLPGADIRVAKIDWNWSPAKLFAGQLHIANVDVSGVVIGLRDSPATPSQGGPVVLPHLLLPLGIALDRAIVTSLQIQGSDGSELFTFDSIDVQLQGKGGRLTIDNLSLQGPEMAVAVHGTVDFDRKWSVDLLGNWQLINYGFHQLEGTFSAAGPFASPHATFAVNRPADIRVEGDVVNLFEKPEWTAVLEARNVDLEALIKHCPKINLATVSGQLSGNTDGYRGLVQAQGTWGKIDNMQLQSSILGGLMGIDFEALRIDRGDGWAVAENAKINWKHIFEWEGLFHFKNFDPSAFFDTLPGRIGTDFTSVGKVRDDLGVDVAFEIFRLDGHVREQPISVVGTIALTENDVRTNDLIVRSGEVEGSARIKKGMISWVEKISWSGEVLLDNFDPAGIFPEFPGQVSGVFAGEGFLGHSGAQGYLRISDISGQLRGNSLAGSGEISLVDDTIHTTGLFLQSGVSQLVVQGQAGDAFALDFTFNSPDIGTLFPETSGAVHLLGKLRGSLRAPLFDVELRGTSLAMSGNNYGLMEANLHSQLGDNSRLQGTLRAEKVSLAGLPLDQAQIDFSGSLKEQVVTGQGAGALGKIGLRATATYGDGWKGELTDFKLTASPYGNWRQQDKAALRVSTKGVFLENFCIAEGAGTVCGGGDIQFNEDGSWLVKSQLVAVPLKLLNSLKILTIPVNGLIDGTIAVSGENHRLLTTLVELKLPKTEFKLDVEDEDLNSIKCEDTVLSLVLANSFLQTNLATSINNGSRLTMTVVTPGDVVLSNPISQVPLSGKLNLENFDLAILSSFTGYGIEPNGRVSSSFTLGGTVGRPELVGDGQIEGGGITLPYQGITLENVRLEVVAAEDGAKVVGHATSGPGEMTAEGRLHYGDIGVEADLRIRCSDFLLVNLPEYAIRVNSDVQFLFARKRGAIKGSVQIPYALITPEELKDSVKVSKDVILVSGRQEVRDSGWPFSLDLAVLLGDDVHIRGYGLTGRLAGKLLVKTAADEFPIATGELDLIDGVFVIYGRTLEIERGRMLFTGGPIDNPGIDVRAQKKFSDEEAKSRGYTVGVDISGLVQDLHYNLFSDPYMDDTEILSQMIVGHSLAFASKEEGSLLGAAATTLGLKGGADLFEGFGDILQLDDMHVEGSTKKENVSLVVGKRVTKDLYIGYDMNMFSQLGQFRVRYDLTRGFAVETRSSSQATGADLLYTFEK